MRITFATSSLYRYGIRVDTEVIHIYLYQRISLFSYNTELIRNKAVP